MDEEPAILAVVSDLHVNSTVALCPPVFKRDGYGDYIPSELQRWVFDRWLHYWRRVWKLKQATGAPVYAVYIGETCDVNAHDGHQLISPNEADIISAALDVLYYPLSVADHHFVLRGTEAHTGGDSWLDEQVAREIGAERDDERGTYSWYFLRLVLGGVCFGFAHHPGTNSTRPWTNGSAAIRASAMAMCEFYGEDDAPELMTYGHVHHDEDSADNLPVRSLFLPSWQAVTSFDSRQGRAYKLPRIGGNIYCARAGRVEIEKVRYEPERRAAWRPTG